MKNIYDIFEERKLDIYYIENFSFNELDELDMVFENMERIFINDEYMVMEDFKERMQDMKDRAYIGMQNLGEMLSRLINNIIVKFNTKFQPVKKHIEKVGVANVNLSKLKNGHVSAIRFSTLEAICEVLDCQPGDILEYQKE